MGDWVLWHWGGGTNDYFDTADTYVDALRNMWNMDQWDLAPTHFLIENPHGELVDFDTDYAMWEKVWFREAKERRKTNLPQPVVARLKLQRPDGSWLIENYVNWETLDRESRDYVARFGSARVVVEPVHVGG